MNRWYVVTTHANREGLAEQQLRKQGFETFLPRIRKRRRHARRVDSILAPMFPRYLFVKMDTSASRWRAINGTFGVSRLLCHGDEPTSMPDGAVKEIMERVGEDGAITPPVRTFSKGERLRLVDGAFADQIGHFENMADEKRVYLLLDLLGRQIRVKTPISFLATA